MVQAVYSQVCDCVPARWTVLGEWLPAGLPSRLTLILSSSAHVSHAHMPNLASPRLSAADITPALKHIDHDSHSTHNSFLSLSNNDLDVETVACKCKQEQMSVSISVPTEIETIPRLSKLLNTSLYLTFSLEWPLFTVIHFHNSQ